MAHGISLRDREPHEVDPAAVENADEAFFKDHPDRKYRIRRPRNVREYQAEFQSLGPHAPERRRIIVARVPFWLAVQFNTMLMPIPFLAFADETIEDRDDILAPIFKGIMENAGAGMGLDGGMSGWW